MTSGCVHPGRVWVCGRSAGRSDSCASREPPLQDWLDNWQLRGIPCGPISSRVCKPHLMTPPVSQGFGCWGLMSMCGITRTDAVVAHELTGIVDLTRGEDHPMACLSGPGAGQVWHRVQERWAERGKDFRTGVRIATLDPLPGTARMPLLGLLQGRNQRAGCLSHRHTRR